MKDKHDYPLVRICWLDSRQPVASWQHVSEIDDPVPVDCESVGWMLIDNKDCKTICANMGDVRLENPQASAVIEIPTKCITSIEPLQLAEHFSGTRSGKIIRAKSNEPLYLQDNQ